MAVRVGTDEQRYKYNHGGRYGDRDLYLLREQKLGTDPNYEERRYRPGYREDFRADPYARQEIAYRPDTYEVRETRAARAADYNVTTGSAPGWVGDPLYRERDYISSYGHLSGSPAGGIRGIDFGHDVNRPPTTYKRVTTDRTTRTDYDDEDYDDYRTSGRSVDYLTSTGRSVDYSTSPGFRRTKTGKKKWTPICDMGETDKYWVVRCELPGVKKDKLSVEIEGKDLIIRGKRIKELWNVDKINSGSSVSTTSAVTSTTAKPADAASKPSATTTATGVTSGTTVTEKRNPDGTVTTTRVAWVDKERGGRGVFKRRIRLPARVEQSAVQALYKDGILEVLVRKPEGVTKNKNKDTSQTNRVAIN